VAKPAGRRARAARVVLAALREAPARQAAAAPLVAAAARLVPLAKLELLGALGDSGTIVPGDGGDPTIKITDPKDLETISKDAEYTMFPKIPIAFEIANFALMAPGSGAAKCPKGVCGHVHINVDGADCNVANLPYNAAAIMSPGIIDLGLCKAGVAGVHTVTASLHNDDHSDVTVTDGGTVISDTITITAKEGDGGTSPDAGDGG